jgi:hypothetical protein
MSAPIRTAPPLFITADLVERRLDNDQARLAEHANFDKEVQLLLTHPEFTRLSDSDKIATLERLYKRHRTALQPLEATSAAIASVAQVLRG